jgi:hypothetical protein
VAAAYLDMFGATYGAVAGPTGGVSTPAIGYFTYSGAEAVHYSGDIYTNTLYTITVNARATEEGGSFATASADPTFSIDSSVPNPGDYTIVLSDGVGNSTAVPEPASSLVFISAFASLLALRQRRRLAVSA